MFLTPSVKHLRAAADTLGLKPSDDYLERTAALVDPLVQAYGALDRHRDPIPEVKWPRTSGTRPSAEDNPYGAWSVRTGIKGAEDGLLRGKRIALKDNVCLAGVPMMNGSSMFEGYVPDADATIVTRILDAGGEIAGKVVCEYYCVSGGSHTASTGHVHNPRKYGYSAGGSSSGSAAVVAAGDVPMSIGGDQAGSIRIPSAYCGTYGLKPTYGLVPYSGIVPLEHSIDHCGPISANVADNALLLQAIAGPDDLDTRQRDVHVDPDYAADLDRGVEGVRIGLLKEGFALSNMEADVAVKVREGAERLAGLGASLEDVSIPMHELGFPIWAPIVHDGGLITMLSTNGSGSGAKGLYLSSLLTPGSAWRHRGDELADTVKIMALFAQYSFDRYRGAYYAKAQNMRRELTRAYDDALDRYDMLLLPTLPVKATPLPGKDAPVEEITARSWEMIANTCAFNVSGHPAISVPCAMSDGRPVGMMLVARHWNERMLYRAAAAFERLGDWTKF